MTPRPQDIDLHDSVAGEEDPGASLDMEPDGGAPAGAAREPVRRPASEPAPGPGRETAQPPDKADKPRR